MKRAKVILSAVALFAVVGGALAFKATRNPQNLYRTNAQGICTVPTTLSLTLEQQFGGQPIATVTSSLFTTSVNGPCPRTTWYTIE